MSDPAQMVRSGTVNPVEPLTECVDAGPLVIDLGVPSPPLPSSSDSVVPDSDAEHGDDTVVTEEDTAMSDTLEPIPGVLLCGSPVPTETAACDSGDEATIAHSSPSGEQDDAPDASKSSPLGEQPGASPVRESSPTAEEDGQGSPQDSVKTVGDLAASGKKMFIWCDICKYFVAQYVVLLC